MTKLTNGEISALCMELSLLLHAGLNISAGLHLLADEGTAEQQAFLNAMAEVTDAGEPLSAAMKASGVFPAYVCGLTVCGEESGRTEEALQALSEYYDGRERLGVRIRSALLYPAVLLLLMLVVIGVLLAKVLPVFNDVFASLGGEMTGLAGGLLALGGGLDAAMPVLLILLAVLVAFIAAFAASASFREKLMNRWTARHGDKGLTRQVAIARFAQAMAMGLRSGMPVEDTLRLAAELGGNPAIHTRCADCQNRLERGDSLADALRGAGILPPAYCRMLALGIRSGTGDTVMLEIARRLEEESQISIETTVGRVEPTLVIVTSLLVGVILLSVMVPLMNIMTAIG
jgi:type IV pilus assembly protein PilC